MVYYKLLTSSTLMKYMRGSYIEKISRMIDMTQT